MMNIEDICKAVHTINKIYCEAAGDFSQTEWEDCPDWQKESARNGVDAVMNGCDSSRGSHESWLKQKIDEGWKYGPEKNAEKKEHPCCVPYDELPVYQRAKDSIFLAVVKGLLDLERE